MSFDSFGVIKGIDTTEIHCRKIQNVKVGDRFKATLPIDGRTVPQQGNEKAKDPTYYTVTDVYPRWIRVIDDEGKYNSFDLGDLVRMGLEPSEPGWYRERR